MSDGEEELDDLQYEVKFELDPEKAYPHLQYAEGKAAANFGNNGDTYVGEYKENQRHGKGTYTFGGPGMKGANYSGDYKNGKKEGKGEFLAPDGGVYSGAWVNDKREGQGTYSYPNGDKYIGEWKNGKKHGQGKYIYGNTSTTMNGTWSNGQMMFGEWATHDGTKYIGKFAQNQLQGAGTFFFPNGNYLPGQYLPSKAWSNTVFRKPSPSDPPPKPVKPEPFKKASRAIDKSVLKADHFEGIYRLDLKHEGVPNFRKVKDFAVFGSGQPTLDGFRKVLEALSEDGAAKVVWTNMRSEPVCYVNDSSYAPRDRRELNENMIFTGLSNADLTALEDRLADKTKSEAKLSGNLVNYYQDIKAENPADRKNSALTSEIKEIADIKTVAQVYALLESEDFDVTYNRLPINDERAPSAADFDRIVTILKETDLSTGVYFNCQMGKGRTTTGMVLAVLFKKTQGGGASKDDDDEKEEEEEADAGADSGAYDPAEPNFKMGQYKIIMDLVEELKDTQLKEDVDDAIDRCADLQNLREVIIYAKEMHDKETNARRNFWHRMAVNFVERYFYLIAFYAYLKQTQETEFEPAFSQWVAEKPELFKLLGSRTSGPLSTFDWQ